MSRALTLLEAADQLRKSKRWLLEWLRAHPADNDGQPFYTPVGRDKIFHQTDIARIELALRGDLQCRSASDRRVKAKPRISRSGEQSGDPKDHSAWKRAAELLGDPTLVNSPDKSQNASRSTAAGPRPRLRVIGGMTS
jgi:hypothetical protein